MSVQSKRVKTRALESGSIESIQSIQSFVGQTPCCSAFKDIEFRDSIQLLFALIKPQLISSLRPTCTCSLFGGLFEQVVFGQENAYSPVSFAVPPVHRKLSLHVFT